MEDPAPVFYGKWLREALAKMRFPSSLQQVPDPADNVLARTNDVIPYSGIWEPIDVPKSSVLSLFSRTAAPQPPFKRAGTMNYLHAGSNAPKIKVKFSKDSLIMNTTWRLLWKDDRYSKGNVPDEEAAYLFDKPDAVIPSPPALWFPKETVWVESGASAPKSGKWLVENDLHVSVILQKGEELPQHHGRDVRWVWTETN